MSPSELIKCSISTKYTESPVAVESPAKNGMMSENDASSKPQNKEVTL